MGLADRFKDSLEGKDIFQKVQKTEPEQEKEMNVVSNPIRKSNNFEELETIIIDKIRKTPYWMEYSAVNQRNMIGAYFTKKLQGVAYSPLEKEEFVQNVLILSNNQ